MRTGPVSPCSRLRSYLELVRVPNLFTAMADVGMGYLFTHPVSTPGDGWRLGLLAAASSAFYAAGVVLNDVVDFEVDRVERPERPLPSGRVSLGAARWLGWELLVVALALGWTAAWLAQSMRPGLVAVALAGAILLYTGLLKPTILGPVAMGACRSLNVLLGMSAIWEPWRDEHFLVAAAVGTYIVGVTWLARTEARRSRRTHLGLASLVILAGLGILGLVPGFTEEAVPLLVNEPWRWTLLMLVLGALVGFRCLRAVVDPVPDRVQMAVRECILSLVILDAAACFVVQGLPGAGLVLALLAPATVLGWWIRST